MSATKFSDDGRFVAIRVLLAVLQQGESLSTAIPSQASALDARDRSMMQAMVYGVLRWRWQLEAMLKPYLKKPLKNKDLDVKVILMLGVYQLFWMRTPDYAAVDAAVKSTQKIKKKWARGLVNAILRQTVRDRESVQISENDPVSFYSHPQWLIDVIRNDWPDNWKSILDKANEPAPMTLRVDTRQVEREKCLQWLAEKNMSATVHAFSETSIVLEKAVDVHELPGFDKGLVSVQDAAAQLAATIIELEPGQKVLDACAAPGGKTLHMLQVEPGITVDAVDISELRLERVAENLSRAQLQANLIAADISQPDEWWDDCQYDRILLDAPCSATGVIRRHPDIKSLRRAEDIEELVATQQVILKAIWPLLRPGGKLLYATCSILRAENEKQVSRFLSETSDAFEQVIEAQWGHQCEAGRQILTGEAQADGFYYALIMKKADG